MLRSLMITTSVVALMTTGALAAEHGDDQTKMENSNKQQAEIGVKLDKSAQHVMASNLLDMAIYSGNGDDAEQIGEVNSLIVNGEGEIAAVVVDVGGFLGIGEKQVAIEFDRLSWSDQGGERRLTASVERAELEDAPSFDRAALRDGEKQTDKADQSTASSEVDAEVSAEERMAASDAEDPDLEDRMKSGETAEADIEVKGDEQQQAGDESRTYGAGETMAEAGEQVDPNTLNADQILGAAVYGAEGENVGEIGDLILSDAEKIEAYVINVGGFLGLGEKPVAVDATDFKLSRDANGGLSLRTPFTEEQLDEQQEYSERAYQENRESVVLTK